MRISEWSSDGALPICGPGTVVPREIRWIAAETNARVKRIVVKPGAQVQADTVILELSNPEVIDQQLGAEAALKAAEADYQAHRMTLESQLLDQRANLAGVMSEYESARLQAEAERDLAQIGRESCRERVGQSVETPGAAA